MFNKRKSKSDKIKYVKLTYKVKHNKDLSVELIKVKLIANFVLEHNLKNKFNKTKQLTSKAVSQFELKSCVSNQIINKYSNLKTIKKIKKQPNLIVPCQGITFHNKLITIPSLKLTIPFQRNVLKICQIELNNEYAFITCNIKEEITQENLTKPTTFIGIDRNATGHIAVCSVGNKILKLGKEATHIHRKYQKLRKSCQKKKKYKFIQKLNNKQSRISSYINHKISRKIVDLAHEKGYGIKLEDLSGINKKLKSKDNKKKTNSKKSNKNKGSKKLHNIISNWSFYQLQTYIEYKSKLLGVPVYYVNPSYTSQTCSRCGIIGDRQGKVFICNNILCRHKDHADSNASFNIAKKSPIQVKNKNKSMICSTADRDVVESQQRIELCSMRNPDMAQVAMDEVK